MTGFLICGGGGGGICSLLVQKPGDKPLCKLSQVLLRLRNVTGESVTPESVPPAYDGGLLRNFFSGVEQPFCKRLDNVNTRLDLITNNNRKYV